ncbi:hypothetical protein BDV93DRAFT_516573 [Ceratobasidium sp. AG-I]|nr:hypothetical protein BDV93DRAFT_516573 [Ceratobasidium sp. AG-I]
MPRANPNTNAIATLEANSEPNPPPSLYDSGYSTRKKPYHYSKTKAPILMSAPRDQEPPQIPASAACKKPDNVARGPKRKVASANSQVLDDRTSNSASQPMDNEPQPETLSAQNNVALPDIGGSTLNSFQEQRAHVNQAESACAANHTIPYLPHRQTEPSPFNNQLPIEPIPSLSPAPPIQTMSATQSTFGPPPTPRLSPVPRVQQTPHIQPAPSSLPAHFNQPIGPVMATPLRPSREIAWDGGAPQVLNPSIAISSPSPVIFRNPPAWAFNFDDQAILNPNFVPNPNLQFENTSIVRNITTSTQFSVGPQDLNGLTAPEDSTTATNSYPPHNGYPARDDYWPSFGDTYRMRTVSPAPPDQSLPIPGLSSAQRRSVSPAITSTNYMGTMYATTGSMSRGSTPQPSELTMLHARVARAFSTSPAPVVSHTAADIPHRAATPANLGSGDALSNPPKPASGFSYGQNEFIREMTHRWHWYLVAEDAFPVGLVRAQEAAIVYAETVLNASRAVEGLTKQHFDYVRKKDSRIRGDLKDGVREKVRAHYQINEQSLALVKELVKSHNFIFTSYDPKDLRVVTGRYRHLCIVDVLTSLFFPARTRGTTIGVRFGRELIEMTPKEVLRGYQDQTASYGAPVAAIALACTLILHALHSLEREIIAYNEGKPRPRVISFEERSYGVQYRGFVTALKGYKRLDLTIVFFRREYTSRVKDTETTDNNANDDSVERCSDGE